VTNGHVDNNLSDMGQDSPYAQPALIWKNEGGRFSILDDTAGEYFRHNHPGRGLAVCDLDNDGDSDVIVAHQDQAPAVLCNDRDLTKTPNSCILRLIGRYSNRDSIGTRVTVQSFPEKEPRQEQIQGGGSYLSAQDLRLPIPLSPSGTTNIEIIWPSGIHQAVTASNQTHQLNVVEPRDSGSPHSDP
jgi:hypothetical protein